MELSNRVLAEGTECVLGLQLRRYAPAVMDACGLQGETGAWLILLLRYMQGVLAAPHHHVCSPQVRLGLMLANSFLETTAAARSA